MAKFEVTCNQCGFQKEKQESKHAYRYACYHEGINKDHSVKVKQK